MTVLWAEIPDDELASDQLTVPEALERWRMYHGDCGMGVVSTSVQGFDVWFECSACSWGERIPFDATAHSPGEHNRAAIHRIVVQRECRDLQVQAVMGGPGVIPLAALLGGALRVTVCPLPASDAVEDV